MVEKKNSKKSVKKKTSKKNKEKVCEVFEVEKDGKEKTIKACGDLPIKNASKKEIENENNVLRNVLIGLGIFTLAFAITMFLIYNSSKIEHEGVKFTKIDYSGLTLYYTYFPIIYQGAPNTYNLYLRKNPKKTVSKVDFEGELIGREEMVIDFEENFNCDGDGIISIANLANLYSILGVNVVKNESFKCDEQGRYIYLNLLNGEETKIVQTAPTCYNLYLNNCEILYVTERFIIETLVKINENN